MWQWLRQTVLNKRKMQCREWQYCLFNLLCSYVKIDGLKQNESNRTEDAWIEMPKKWKSRKSRGERDKKMQRYGKAPRPKQTNDSKNNRAVETQNKEQQTTHRWQKISNQMHSSGRWNMTGKPEQNVQNGCGKRKVVDSVRGEGVCVCVCVC